MLLIESVWNDIEGTECYCSDEAAELIRSGISVLPLEAVHYLGSGDYHYQTLFWLERISEPFRLVLFDNHPDSQSGAFGDRMLSCGNWVLQALRLPMLQAMDWYDGNGEKHEIKKGGNSLPAYLSIDLDILSEEYAHTNWNQGRVTIDGLKALVRSVGSAGCMGGASSVGSVGSAGSVGSVGGRLLGADICGERSAAKGGTPEDSVLNRRSIETLLEAL